MHNLSLIEEYYKRYIQGLYYWIPEGIYTINLNLLNHFNLLHFQYPESQDPLLSQHFHIVESPDKILLINDTFIIWIIPDRIDHLPITYTLIAFNREDQPKLEVAFVASGVYNTSRVVLRVLEKFLNEIQENERMLDNFSLSG